MSGRYEMFTEAGNEAVANLLRYADRIVAEGVVHDRDTLFALISERMDFLARQPGTEEIRDTEPRGHIADHLDSLCEARGWAYDPWEGF